MSEFYYIIGFFVQGFLFGFLSQIIASSKGHHSGTFFWLGFFCSFVGLLFAIGMPDRTSKGKGDAPPPKRPPKPPASKVPADLYLLLNGEVKGPFTSEQVEGFLQVGTATKETQYCVEGSDDWQPLSFLSSF